jgi:hypothetical protein
MHDAMLEQFVDDAREEMMAVLDRQVGKPLHELIEARLAHEAECGRGDDEQTGSLDDLVDRDDAQCGMWVAGAHQNSRSSAAQR